MTRRKTARKKWPREIRWEAVLLASSGFPSRHLRRTRWEMDYLLSTKFRLKQICYGQSRTFAPVLHQIHKFKIKRKKNTLTKEYNWRVDTLQTPMWWARHANHWLFRTEWLLKEPFDWDESRKDVEAPLGALGQHDGLLSTPFVLNRSKNKGLTSTIWNFCSRLAHLGRSSNSAATRDTFITDVSPVFLHPSHRVFSWQGCREISLAEHWSAILCS